MVVLVLGAGVYIFADDVRLDHNVVANFEALHAVTDFVDHTRHFVAERYWSRFTRDRVRLTVRRYEERAVEVLVQVGTADTTPGNVDSDGSRLYFRGIDVLDADVFVVVVACSLHSSLLMHSRMVGLMPSVLA